MSINQDPEAKGAPERYSTTYIPGGMISEVHPVADDSTLRKIVFTGILTKQMEIKEGAAYLSNEASALFISRLATIAGEVIVLTPSLSHHALPSMTYADKTMPIVVEFLKELQAATDAINKKYSQIGGSLGKPVTDVEFGGKDLEVPYRKYEHGAIYVMPRGTFEVHGGIYRKYVALRAHAGFFGFPISDERSTSRGMGRFNNFQGGAIYWSLATGAWSIYGPMRNKWEQLGGAEDSYLGFPVSDIELVSSGSVSYFQHGSLVMSFDGTFPNYPLSVQYRVEFDSGVKGWSEFGMNSRGEWFFRGHLHNDNFAGNTTTVAASPVFVDAANRTLAVTAERSLGGTFSAEPRNDDWDQVGIDNYIRENWHFLQHANIRFVMKIDTQIGDVLEILIPVIAVAIIVGGGVNKKWCGPVGSQSRDPYTGETQSHIGWELAEPDQPCPPGYN